MVRTCSSNPKPKLIKSTVKIDPDLFSEHQSRAAALKLAKANYFTKPLNADLHCEQTDQQFRSSQITSSNTEQEEKPVGQEKSAKAETRRISDLPDLGWEHISAF